MDYQYITEEEKNNIIENQLKQLEANHFSLKLIEPSKLVNPNEHMAWQQQRDIIEDSLSHMRKQKIKRDNG